MDDYLPEGVSGVQNALAFSNFIRPQHIAWMQRNRSLDGVRFRLNQTVDNDVIDYDFFALVANGINQSDLLFAVLVRKVNRSKIHLRVQIACLCILGKYRVAIQPRLRT